MDATEQTDADTSADAEASATTEEQDAPNQTPAETPDQATAEATTADAAGAAETEIDGAAADPEATAEATGTSDSGAAPEDDAGSAKTDDSSATAESGAADTDTAEAGTADTGTADTAAETETAEPPTGVTADPSADTAVGSSGARALGDATQIADQAADAVDRMNAASEGANGADSPAATDELADAPAAAAESTNEAGDTDTADVPAAAADSTSDELADAPAAAADSTSDELADAPAAAAESTSEAGDTDTADAPAAAADSTSDELAEAPPAAPVAPRVYDGPEPTTMEELLNEQQTEIRSLKHGDVVEGNVVRIDKDEILVDIGAKSEGVISNRELYGRNAETQPQLNIGDQVLVYVLQPESQEGHAVLSLRRAGLERKWRAMQEQLDEGAIIEAPVIDHNKGGLIVDCGIRGFVPISQIVDFPRRPQNEQPRDAAQEIAEKLQPYVGRKLRLKILEVNRKANRLILSEKVALYEERREKRDELFSSLQVGQKVTGTVRSIAPFGVFVDLGGIDGLVHKSELSWNKVNNPEAGYRVGEEVEAEVIDINHERGRISLSIRRLQPDPWHSTVADLKVGDIIDGTVTKIVNFGAFVRVRDGLEGLIHISELSHQRVAHPGDVVQENQTIKLKIISLDQERHRLGLSLKQAEEAPARPEPSTSAPRERRPRGEGRGERSYDMSQAVQEPEGGIDNTLAAAFAQVRAQMAQTEAARDAADDSPEATADSEANVDAGHAETADAPAAEVTAEAPAAEADAEAPAAEETAEAPAAEADAEAPAAEAEAEAPAAEETAEAPAQAVADAMNEAPAPDVAEDTAEAKALEVGPAEDDAKPAKKGRASSKKSDAESATEAGTGSDEPASESADATETEEPPAS